ncbi:MAG: Ig-like domain-containing protein [bacterium]
MPALAKPAPRLPGPIPNDVLFVPPQKRPSKAPTWQEGSPQTPQGQETSEYMAGRVVVGIIFPESNGSSDPSTEDWTATERNNVISEIIESFSWWVARAPANTNLSFIYRDEGTVSTRYEPITHDQNYAQTWVADVMANMGYSSGDHLDRVFAYANGLKNTYQTDWAFTVFIADSSNDADGEFTDGTFGWAWLGGPYLIMTYDNNGYTIGNMAAVCAHEMGHIFYAMDQYASSGCTISERSGYLNITNSNCENGGTAYACIMRGGVSPYTTGAVSTSVREQIGWRDSDSDGVLDIFDLSPQTNLTAFTPDPTTDPTPTYSGSAAIVEAYPNNNPNSHYGAGGGSDINIDHISGVQYRYRLDAGSWSSWLNNSTANDGAFDEPSENFSFTPPTLANGTYTFEVKAVTYLGSEDSTPAIDTLTIVSGAPTCTLTSPSALTWYKGTITLSASASDPDGTISLVEFDYSLDHSSWSPCSASPDTSQPFSINWGSIPSTGVDATVWIRARAKDNAGAYSAYDEQQIQIDNQAPSTTDNYNGAWYNQDFTITLTANDGSGSGLDNSDIRYRINGGAEKNLANHGQPVISGEGGDNQLEYWAIDRVGNEESHHLLIRIKLDRTGPVFGPYALAPPDLTEKTIGSLTVSLIVSDTLSGTGIPQLDYRLDSTNYDGYEAMSPGEGDTWSFSIPPPSDWADHQGETLYWLVRGKDLADNEAVAEEGSEFIEVVNDTPTCQITSPDSFTWLAGQILITTDAADDEAMDSVEFVFSLDGQAWEEMLGSPVTSLPYQLNWNTSPADGVDTEVYLMARAWDLTGLDSGWDTVVIRVDNQPPETSTSADTSSWHTSDITISLEASDGIGAGVLNTCYQVNGGETKCQSVYGRPVISTEGADNSFIYWSIDQMGNQEATKLLSGLKLDKTSPQIVAWSLDPEDLTEDTIGPLHVIVIIEEALSGLAKVEFDWRIGEAAYDGYEAMNNGGGNTWSASIPEPTELWDNERGKNIYLRIMATDVAGNTGLEEITELIDSINDPPTCQLIYPDGPDWYAGVIEIQTEADDPDNAIDRVEFQYYRQGIWEDCAGSPVRAGLGTVYSLDWSSQPSDSLDTGVVLRVRAVDEDQLASEYDTTSIWVDNQPPVTTAVYEDVWHSEVFSIFLVATDGNGSGVETTTYRINSGTERHDTQPLIDLEGTDNRLSYWSIDKLGNQESLNSLSGIKLDLTPPVISDWQKYPPNLIEDSIGPLTVYVSVTDTLSGFSGTPQFDYRFSQAYDGWEDMTSQGGKRYFFSIPEPGLWDDYRGETISFKVKAADVAGRVIEGPEQEELIDSINDPPFCRLITPVADNWYGGEITLSAEAIDSDGEIAGVEFAYLLAEEWVDLPLVSRPPYQIEWDSQPETGVKATVKIRVRSRDNEGAYSNYDEVQIRIDNEAPATSHDYDGAWHTQNFTITLTAEDGEGSGVAAIYYRLNGGEKKNIAAHGQPLITTEHDNNILEYWSVDQVGNQASSQILTGIKLDKSPPPPPLALTADGENPSPWKNSSRFIIDWIDPTDLSGIGYAHYQLGSPPESKDEGESTTLHPFKTLSTQPGGQKLYLWLEDALGQLDYRETASVELRYDPTPPEIGAFLTDPMDLTEDSAGAFRIKVEVGDEGGSGLDRVELAYKMGEGAWSEFSAMTEEKQAFDIPEPNSTWDGVRGEVLFYQVRATDQAGNIIFSSTKEELVDDINDPPHCSWIQPEGNAWLGGELKLEFDCRDQDGKIDRVFIQVSLDNGLNWQEVSGSPITSPPYYMNWHSLPAQGLNSNVILRARARDDEGAYSVWAEKSIKVDNQAPATAADYEPGWRRQDFIIELTADDGQGSGVEDIYYQINDGQGKRVSLDGQPFITTEGADNILVYWAVDYTGHQEAPQRIEGIGLDKTAPTIIEISQEPEDLTEHFEGDLIIKVTVVDEGGSGRADLQMAKCGWRMTELPVADCGLRIVPISEGGFQMAAPDGGWESVAGQELTYQIKVEDGAGNVTLSPEQTEPIEDAPTITLLTPPAEGVVVKDSYQIRWDDEDSDNDAIISLFYQSEVSNLKPAIRNPSSEIRTIRNPKSEIRNLIISGLSEDEETDSYLWDTSGVKEGEYRLSAEISDGRFTSLSLSPGLIRVDHTPPHLEWVTANQDGFRLYMAEENLPLKLKEAVFTVTEADTPTVTHLMTASYLDENNSGLVHLEVEGMRTDIAYILKVDGIEDMVGNQTPPVVVSDIIFTDPTEENIITRPDGTGLEIPAGTFEEQVTLFMDISPSSLEVETADRAAESDPSIGYLVPESVRGYRVIGEEGETIPSDGFNHPVRVTIPYPVDLPINEFDLLIYRLERAQWVMAGRIVNRDRDKHTLTAEVSHLSVFRIAEYVPLPADDLSKIIIYPTLFTSSKHEAIVFEGLKEGIKIHIFNLAGQLVKAVEPSESRWRWWVNQERLASGVYIYRLSDGKARRAGRLVIIQGR